MRQQAGWVKHARITMDVPHWIREVNCTPMCFDRRGVFLPQCLYACVCFVTLK
jgi:hypothetical protein